MKILIVEDDEDKLRTIQSFLLEDFAGIEVIVARSFGSGLRSVISLNGKIDVVILDMSMPNYDVSADEPSGGTPEPYAGKELLAQMKLRQIDTPAIVVTMFDSFGGEGDRKSLANLMSELKSQYSPPYIETVFYDTRQEGWRSSLSDIILTIERNGKK